MGLFYAYLKDANSDMYYRHIITFASREIADEWWRMISTSPSPYSGSVKRISPQFYAYSRSTVDLPSAFFRRDDLPGANQFLDKMFFTDISDKNQHDPTAIPPVEVTDHISGRWYFIRSKAEPSSHWYLRISGACLVCGDVKCDAVHVSSEHRTKFRVQFHPGHDFQVPEEFVMIGRDEISITARKGYTVHVNNAEDLKATKGYQGETNLLLHDLKDRFIARAEKQVNGEMWEYVESVEKGSGETWELVD